MLLFACGPTVSRSSADAVTFDTEAWLDVFDFAASADGGPGKWSIIDNDAGRGLARIRSRPNDDRLAFALYRPFSGRDVYVSTRFLTLSGKIDQAAGLFVRFRSPDDYYAVHANALENSVTLYRIAAGRREMIGSMDVNVSGRRGIRSVSRPAMTGSWYFSTARSFLSRPTEGFRALPARSACGPKQTA
jgi:hypothetical protein